jgi:ribosome-associated protein
MRDLAELVREAALDKKAEDVTTIDLAGRTVVADQFVICSGRSSVQNRAIADGIEAAAAAAGFSAGRTEGYADGNWILIDLGPVIVHIFTPEQRAFYNLERLWGGATPAAKESGG